MQNKFFPVFKTKNPAESLLYRLEDPAERRKYFREKVGAEVEKIREYLDSGKTFVGFMLGKKNSGKGTYSKLFMEALGGDRIAHISMGDVVRSVDADMKNPERAAELEAHLHRTYRGFTPLSQIFEVLKGRDTKTLLPTEVVLSLMEREIARLGRKAIFVDGFPRNLDQISYSLYFRALMGYRDDPDFFVFIHVPESIIEARMQGRVICPSCQTPRHPKLLRTKEIGYDEEKKEFYLICDHSECAGVGEGKRMVSKEGDELGMEAVRERNKSDEKVMDTLLRLEGVPKIYLRNAVPVAEAGDALDEYEITPSYRYEWDGSKVIVHEEPWIVKDDEEADSYSLLPPAIVVSFVKQTAKVLDL